VLGQQRGHRGRELAGLAQAREHVALFEALVEAFDEVVDDQRGVLDLDGDQRVARGDLSGHGPVAEQHPLEHAVLAHEVVVGREGVAGGGHGAGGGPGGAGAGRAHGHGQAAAASRTARRWGWAWGRCDWRGG
jgi:hypothetical protein